MNTENVGQAPQPQKNEERREGLPGADELTGDEGGAGHFGQHSSGGYAASEYDDDDDDVVVWDDDAIDPDRSTD